MLLSLHPVLPAVLQLNGAAPLDLKGHWVGIVALVVFGVAYLLVVFEEPLRLRKSKPVVLAAGAIWILIGIGVRGTPWQGEVAAALKHDLLDYAQLFLFVLAAMTYVNTMEERQVFDALRAWLVRRGLSLRSLFWATGLLAFVLSAWLDNLTTALVIGTVAITLGKDNPRFVAVACINVVVAANAGGAFTPFGDITSLMVWQAGRLGFAQFFPIFLPSLVSWLVPALAMSLVVPRVRPALQDVDVRVRTGGLGVVALFALTIALTVGLNSWLDLPPALGMMTGLGLLNFHAYYLQRRYGDVPTTLGEVALPTEPVTPEESLERRRRAERRRAGGLALAAALAPAGARRRSAAGRRVSDGAFDIFKVLQRAEWDTLLFFYGVVLCVGGLATIGYLAWLSRLLYSGLGPTWANAAVGAISSIVDNIPVMFSVLSMNPHMDVAQWQLVTLTTAVGGSIFSIGSAAGVALMGQARGSYTFTSHLKWSWAIALGYAAAIGVHLLIGGY